jgi:hypothetical protein
MSFIPELDGRSVPELKSAFDSDPGRLFGLPEDDKRTLLDEIAVKIAATGKEGSTS